MFVLTKKAHSDVIPQRSTVWILRGYYTVLEQSGVKVASVLDDTASGEKCFHVFLVDGEGRA